MNIQVSKVFANYINKTAKEMGFKADAYVATLSEGQYHMMVANPEEAIWDGRDFDWNTGKFKAICIEYPDDYYACPQYLTTLMLVKEFRRRGVSTESELKEMIRDMVEI